jgi:hypothetical protein
MGETGIDRYIEYITISIIVVGFEVLMAVVTKHFTF